MTTFAQRQWLCHSLITKTSTSRFLAERSRRLQQCPLSMVLAQDPANSSWGRSNSSNKRFSFDPGFENTEQQKPKRKKYKRKRIPETERERKRLSKQRQQQYERIVKQADGTAPSIWSFECLFPKPVRDEKTIDEDLYGVSRRDQQINEKNRQFQQTRSVAESDGMASGVVASGSTSTDDLSDEEARQQIFESTIPVASVLGKKSKAKDLNTRPTEAATVEQSESAASTIDKESKSSSLSGKVDFALTRMVEDRLYGYRRGSGTYDTSLMGDGAVQFREGVRLGRPLPVNADILNYHAKKELRSNRLEEAQELYEMAIQIDPRDGRAYLGLSRCAQRRRDFKLARECLKIGIAQSVSCAEDSTPDNGANPFLLQALGCLEEKSGRLAEAESLYISAVRSRPSHAASWVALAQLRTRKFRQGAAAGRVCYQAAERELNRVGLPPSSYVYTAWASMEYKKCGDIRRARKLFKAALTVDKKCSAAWLQLGCMEAHLEKWNEAELCFETVLKFDQRNSRVLQAYAIMESKRPDSNSRKVIGLFERALKANPRDAGVLQPYGLYVARLGDMDSARELLRRATDVNKRHAPAWQAWGVMESREGNPEEARNIFQQGIWACAQLTGGQSGGYSCARLWQGWGVLEASEGDYAAARRCFSRALDADNRNVAAITAWTNMEEELGNLDDARALFRRSLKNFTPGTDETNQLWRAYELMEQRAGNEANAQEVYRQSMRESFSAADLEPEQGPDPQIMTRIKQKDNSNDRDQRSGAAKDNNDKAKREFEVSRWDNGGGSMKAEIFMDGSIEGKMPPSAMKKKKKLPTSTLSSSSGSPTSLSGEQS
eukprot:CAMPEP_0172373856 /NCGR_PEP_ID=MMETSP1060-20121228/53503_1 /TAXON_ID=37318 /ORGANISM="Pseudo-nitzschia pungens, Strain cf. cingulata" /LENGTH=833 /DNA_ID=CAMNT_0013100311 /DNA_START=453 /DNA_END=2954 /DNA_ORIENTATION=+